MPSARLVATFSDPAHLTEAVRALREERYPIRDVYAPCPIHGLEHAMKLRHTRLPWVAFLGGMAGLVCAIVGQFYTAVLDWPLNVGGKPDNSTLAFIPITFELTVLFGGLASVAALFLRGRLYPGKREQLVAAGITNDSFAIEVRQPEAPFDAHRVWQILTENGGSVHGERIEGE